MKVISTDFKDLFVLEPVIHKDERGFFFEAFNSNVLRKNGLEADFVQDNQSFSQKGVLRGMHFQRDPFAQTKLVRVLSGEIQDVVIDLRKGEPTFKKWYSIDLSAENKKQLWVPKGFAHGFLVLSETAEVIYKCDNYYHPEAEGGVIFNDPEVGIHWKTGSSSLIVSKKDQLLPLMSGSYFF